MGLDCWLCVAEDCGENPSGNYKATRKSCEDGEQCQVIRGEYALVTPPCDPNRCPDSMLY